MIGYAERSPAAHLLRFTYHRISERGWLAITAAILFLVGFGLLTFLRVRRRWQARRRLADLAWLQGQAPPRSRRDWAGLAASSLPGLAALAAVIISIFSFRATSQATRQQLQITERGQITERYNAAITNLASGSIDIRLGGIDALRRLMLDSPPDQPTIVGVLCAFIRDKSASTTKVHAASAPSLPTDVQAALTVVGTRKLANDSHTTIDLDHALLIHAQLGSLSLASADLTGANLTGASLNYTNLTRANLTGANLTGANMLGTHLDAANLAGAKLTLAHLTGTDLRKAYLRHVNLKRSVLVSPKLAGASFSGANLTGAVLTGEKVSGLFFATANLTGADVSGTTLTRAYLVAASLARAKLVSADLTRSDLTGADLSGADLRYATLKGENLSYADLAHADLYAAKLTGANLTGANLTRAELRAAIPTRKIGPRVYVMTNVNLTGANLRCALWPEHVKTPVGWQRQPGTDYLKRPGQIQCIKRKD